VPSVANSWRFFDGSALVRLEGNYRVTHSFHTCDTRPASIGRSQVGARRTSDVLRSGGC
jgi:hypothetical protein